MHWTGRNKDGRIVGSYSCSGFCKMTVQEQQDVSDALRGELEKLALMDSLEPGVGPKH
jgi:hypothetical protein